MLKKSILVVTVLLVATNLWAAKKMDVSSTRHNLSSTSDDARLTIANFNKASNEDEVCIFCHTPHGGTANTPLWNRALPTGAFTHYTSTTLTAEVGLPNRAVSPESLLCMSCHDGAIAMNSIINNSNRTGAAPNNVDPIQPIIWMGMPGAAIGMAPDGSGGLKNDGLGSLISRDLSDDHPISFSYSRARNDNNTSNLKDEVAVRAAGIRLFGPDTNTADGNRVECSSCHDPHVNYEPLYNGGDAAYAPFLVTPNAGSALCLGCHIK